MLGDPCRRPLDARRVAAKARATITHLPIITKVCWRRKLAKIRHGPSMNCTSNRISDEGSDSRRVGFKLLRNPDSRGVLAADMQMTFARKMHQPSELRHCKWEASGSPAQIKMNLVRFRTGDPPEQKINPHARPILLQMDARGKFPEQTCVRILFSSRNSETSSFTKNARGIVDQRVSLLDLEFMHWRKMWQAARVCVVTQRWRHSSCTGNGSAHS